MDDHSEKVVLRNRKMLKWLWILPVLALVLSLLVALIVFAIKANSKACKDGLLAEQKCLNKTRLLELQLTQAQESLVVAEAQAYLCNQTVVSCCHS